MNLISGSTIPIIPFLLFSKNGILKVPVKSSKSKSVKYHETLLNF